MFGDSVAALWSSIAPNWSLASLVAALHEPVVANCIGFALQPHCGTMWVYCGSSRASCCQWPGIAFQLFELLHYKTSYSKQHTISKTIPCCLGLSMSV